MDARTVQQQGEITEGASMPVGNWQSKKRKNLYVTRDAEQMSLELACKLGLNDGGVYEVAIRELYKKEIGEFNWTRPMELRRGKAQMWDEGYTKGQKPPVPPTSDK